MMLACPWCGSRPIEEFVHGGDATPVRPDLTETDPAAWLAYLYERDNPCGRHREYWHHERGCRQWLVVERDTATHAVYTVELTEGPERCGG
jgi:heterotetrameric sarcosine oxidase delta subunit